MITKKILGCCILLMSLGISASFSAEDSTIESTVVSFFNALKNGDVVAVEKYIADPLYSEIKPRLNSDGYPAFLQQYYSNSYIDILNIHEVSNDQKNVILDLYFSSNEKQSIELQVHKSTEGDWKITKQSEFTE